MATFIFQGKVLNDPEWSSAPNLVFGLGEVVDVDLRLYLNDDFTGTITHDASTDDLPAGLEIVDMRYLRGTVTAVDSNIYRRVKFIASNGLVSVTSGEFLMATIGYHTWMSPAVTNLENDESIDQFVGRAFQIGDGIKFDAKFQLQKTGSVWTVLKPRLSLPVATSSPSNVIGQGIGYGGSEHKFFETLFGSNVVNEGNITGAATIAAATIHNGTVYIGRNGGLILTLNPTTRVATEYVDTGNHVWDALASHNGTLYGWNSSTNQRLYSIASSGATAIGNDQNIGIFGMASVGGVLYGSGGTGLRTINTSDSTTTNVGNYSPGANVHTLFSIGSKLYGTDSSSPYEIWEINTATAAVTKVSNVSQPMGGSFVLNDKLYTILNNSTTLYSLELNVPPLTSVDFSGPDYTSALATCELQSNLIQVNVEKLQRDSGTVLVNISGSYEK